MNSISPSGNDSPVRLGIVPHCDSAPIAVAQKSGIFERHGLKVQISKELDWASIQNKIHYGELDAAQSISSIAMSLSLGIGDFKCEVAVPLILSLHGNAITLSSELSPSAIQDGQGLSAFLTHYWKKNRPLTFATPHRHSSHHILLHSWLRRYGVDPKRDAEIIVLPPALMPHHLKTGQIDGYCVGEPWNSVAILDGYGWSPATSADLSYGHPEKVLLVAGRFLRDHRDRTVSLVTALLEACKLCQDPAFQNDMIDMLSEDDYIGISPHIIRNSFCGRFVTGRETVNESAFHLFHGDTVNRPTAEKAFWQLAGLKSIGALPEMTGGSLSRIHREEIYNAAIKQALPV